MHKKLRERSEKNVKIAESPEGDQFENAPAVGDGTEDSSAEPVRSPDRETHFTGSKPPAQTKQVFSSARCMMDLAARKNPQRLIFASQDPVVRRELMSMAGAPLIFASEETGQVLMAAPSMQSEQRVQKQKRKKLVQIADAALLNAHRDLSIKNKKRSEKNAPNPLSVRKKAKEPASPSAPTKKRTRSKSHRNKPGQEGLRPRQLSDFGIMHTREEGNGGCKFLGQKHMSL